MPSVDYFYRDRRATAELDEVADMCPHCKISCQISPISAYRVTGRPHLLQVVFQCPRNDCGFVFVSYYTMRENRTYRGHTVTWNLAASEPISFVTNPTQFSDHITNMSKEFAGIFNQAKSAEENGMDMICGPGYGKALEFLLKDYLIHQKPEDAEKIKGIKNIGSLIDRLEDPKAKIVVERAAWVRNDETHYTRKFEDRDLEDLKTLITLSVHWIESALITEEYEKGMQSKNKPGKEPEQQNVEIT
jgi:hypothetical protein